MAPKLSVVVPFYGVEDYIDECLATIAAQTLTDFECILIDDGSRDGSRAIADRWAASDPRFRVVAQPNAGLGAARNTGTSHAVGEYLMFIDSDDLLAPRAFEQLVTSLDASGSDFAAGNVWRLSPKWGLFVSTAHAEEFGQRREGVTIADVPLLIRDRMIWNKVFRRSFWDTRGYAFPEMRFEDYPVTLKAHLEADAVDLLPDPLYVWREREAGTSISQQSADIRGIRDRARATHLVLDLVEAQASEEVKDLVHSYFVHVDLWELLRSMLVIADADRDELERHAASVVDRIPPGRTGHVVGLHRWLYRAARAHDWALTRALTRWWDQEGWAGVRRELPLSDWRTPLRASAMLRLRRGEPRVGPRHLPCELSSLAAGSGRAAEVVIDVRLRSQTARVARASVLVGGTPVPSSAVRGGKGLLVRGTLPAGASGAVEVDVVAGPLHYRGGPTLASTPAIIEVADGWVQAAEVDKALALVRPEPAVVAVAAEPAAELAGVVLRLVGEAAEAVVVRPYPDAPIALEVVDGVVRLVWDDLLADDPPDNPVTHGARRPIVARTASGEVPVYRTCGDVEATASGRRVLLTADAQGRLELVHEPVRS